MKRYISESLLLLATAITMSATMCGCATKRQASKLQSSIDRALGKSEILLKGTEIR
jgi:hypothetical protein